MGHYIRESTNTKRRNPVRFGQEDLLPVDITLREMLERETSIGVRSTVD